MNIREKIEYWVDIAEYDLETAKVMLEGKRFLYVGFMCCQVIEKVLKAHFVYVLKDAPPYTHNLSFLAEKARIYSSFSEEQKELIEKLEPLNIETRYPVYKERLLKSLNYEICKRLLTETEELYKWIKKKL